MKRAVCSIFLLILQLNDNTQNLKESTANQMDVLNIDISKSRKNLSTHLSELQKTIETVAAEMRSENSTSLTNQVGHDVRLICKTESLIP